MLKNKKRRLKLIFFTRSIESGTAGTVLISAVQSRWQIRDRHNKTLTLTTSPRAANSYCTTTVGTLTVVNQVKQRRSLSGPQAERRFNGILGALHIKAGGRTGKRLFL